MTSLVIIDDEPIIREGLASIPWKDHGIRLVGIAGDSDEALALVREKRPGIVLTDIRMPGIDGIELSRIIREERPETQIIMLTGHGSMDYARAAIRLGVSEFLLKPTDPPTVIASVLKAKRAIAEEEHRRRDAQYAETALVEQKLQELAAGCEGDAAAAAIRIVRQYTPLRPAAVVLLGGSDLGPIPAALRDRVRRAMRRHGRIFFLQRSRGAECCVVDASESSERDEPALAREMVKMLQQETGFDVRAGVATIGLEVGALAGAVDDAHLALAAAWLLEGREAVSAEELSALAGGWDTPATTALDALAEALGNGESGRILEQLRHLGGMADRDAAVLPRLALALLWRSLAPLDLTGILRLREVAREAVASVVPPRAALERLVSLLAAAPHPPGQDRRHNTAVRRTLDYIAESYAADASLKEAARRCCLHPVYLGRLIKRETGKTFTDLLAETRIDRACRLLRQTDARVYEVAERVGFADARYFSDLFKQRLLVTPQEYRRREQGRP